MVKKNQVDLYNSVVIKEYNIPNKAPDGSVYITQEYETIQVINKEYKIIKNEYLSLIKKYRENEKDKIFIGGMPVTLDQKCMKELLRINPINNELVYGMTLKVDGERLLMFLTSFGNIYYIDRSMNFFYFTNDDGTRHTINNTKPFLFDGEIITYSESEYEYLIFDVLFYPNEKETVSWMEYDYNMRYQVLKYAVDNVLKPYYDSKFTDKQFYCFYKTWYPIDTILSTNDIYKYIEYTTNQPRSKKYKLKADGIILQPFDGVYIPFTEWNHHNNIQFKWKPPEDLTIDFKIKAIKPNLWHLLTGTGQTFMINQPKGFKPVPATCIPTKTNKLLYNDGDVAEFILQQKNNPQKNLFNIVRLRPEKDANSYNTIMSTLEIINGPAFYLDILKPTLMAIKNPSRSKDDLKKILSLSSKSKLILCIMSSNTSFFTKKEISEISLLYNKYTEVKNTPDINYELEFKLFKRGKKGNILDKFSFYFIYDYLYKNFPSTFLRSVDISFSKGTKSSRSTYKSIKDVMLKNSLTDEYKNKIDNFILYPTDKGQQLYNNTVFKLDLSEEIKTNIQTNLKNNNVNNLIRLKERSSFKINKLWRIDITKVLSSYNILDIESKNFTYEIEGEFIGGQDISFDVFIKSFSDLYILLLTNSSYC